MKMSAMVVEHVAIATLRAAEYNPRKLSVEAADELRASIREFGLVEPIVVNKREGRYGVIVGGHMRFSIAIELGFTAVPVVFVDLDEARERELNLRLNKNVGEWDWDKLAEFDLDVLTGVGFTEDELSHNFDVGASGDEDAPFSEFNDGAGSKSGVAFKFGDYSGRVAQKVYDSFREAYEKRKLDGGEVVLDDVIRRWLSV